MTNGFRQTPTKHKRALHLEVENHQAQINVLAGKVFQFENALAAFAQQVGNRFNESFANITDVFTVLQHTVDFLVEKNLVSKSELDTYLDKRRSDLMDQVEQENDRRHGLVVVDRAAQIDDVVVLKVLARKKETLDGIKELSSDYLQVIIGVAGDPVFSKLLDELDKAVVGLKADESRSEIEVTTPSDFYIAELANVPVLFDLTVLKVKEKVVVNDQEAK